MQPPCGGGMDKQKETQAFRGVSICSSIVGGERSSFSAQVDNIIPGSVFHAVFYGGDRGERPDTTLPFRSDKA